MQKELIKPEHEALLKDEFGVTFDDIEKMTDDEYDEFLDEKLAMAECDEDGKADGDEPTERGRLIGEIIDILCGPYEDEDEEE
jgi:hypothetical protein